EARPLGEPKLIAFWRAGGLRRDGACTRGRLHAEWSGSGKTTIASLFSVICILWSASGAARIELPTPDHRSARHRPSPVLRECRRRFRDLVQAGGLPPRSARPISRR